MSAGWTTPDDIAARVRRRWDDGSLLRAYANGGPFDPIEVALRGPKPSQVGDDLAAAREWVAASTPAVAATVDTPSNGSRSAAGRSAAISCRSARWCPRLSRRGRCLGVAASVRRFDELLNLAEQHPQVRSWVVDHPLRALELGPRCRSWSPPTHGSTVIASRIGTSGRSVRPVSIPNLPRGTDPSWQPCLAFPRQPRDSWRGSVYGRSPDWSACGPRRRWASRLRLTELAVRSEELAQLTIEPRTAVVVENEITYLSVDVPEDGVVIWGKGFEVDRVGRLPWLADADIVYWGDIDTHGFAILDRLRAWLPRARSVLMDRETLLAHRDRWVSEDRPATSSLTRLTPEERDLYTELVGDALGERVRLEQERIDWDWVEQRLPAGNRVGDRDQRARR